MFASGWGINSTDTELEGPMPSQSSDKSGDANPPAKHDSGRQPPQGGPDLGQFRAPIQAESSISKTARIRVGLAQSASVLLDLNAITIDSKPEAPEAKAITTAKQLDQSVLNYAVHQVLDPIENRLISNQSVKDSIADGVTGVIKMAPLFMGGRGAAALTAITFATDEIKTTDRGSAILADGVLGVGKAASLKLTQHYLAGINQTPTLAGVELGVVNRATDVGLTRQNYYDKSGNFNLSLGVERALQASVESIGTDALIYGASDYVWGKKFLQSRGTSTYNAALSTAFSAGTFNATVAAGTEVSREIKDGKFDPKELAIRTFAAGTVGLGTGYLAGLQRHRYLSLNIEDSPTALREARNTPFQRGEIAQAQTLLLRDGRFEATSKIVGPTGISLIGKVVHSEGEIPAIFRIDDGTESFAHRMQSEIAGYGLNKTIGFNNSFPATVRRSVEYEGEKLGGFVQEANGANLVDYFKAKGVQANGIKLDKSELLKTIRSDPALLRSLGESWVERLTYGEWDNHAMNQVAVGTARGDEIRNIDLGDGMRSAQTQLDLIPNPGLRRGYENANSYIYGQLAGSKLEPDLIDKSRRFVELGSTIEGRQHIQSFGLTPQQTEGILGRSKWFADHGYFPQGGELHGYGVVQPVLSRVKRVVKTVLKSALQ